MHCLGVQSKKGAGTECAVLLILRWAIQDNGYNGVFDLQPGSLAARPAQLFQGFTMVAYSPRLWLMAA
eukprot:1159488-Pelagomonas_calceolata.AAC.14